MDRITKVWFKNLRTLADVTLDLDGLTVLVGENGAGKSTIIEGLQLLARCARPDFLRELAQVHGGAKNVARSASAGVVLGCRVSSEFDPQKGVEYEIQIGCSANLDYLSIHQESLQFLPEERIALEVLHRVREKVRLPPTIHLHGEAPRAREALVPYGETALSSAGIFADPSVDSVRRALGSIAVHGGFRLAPRWVVHSSGMQSSIRTGSVLQRADRLELGASNLASVYHHLKHERGPRHWGETLEVIRLGIGDCIEDVGVSVDADSRATLSVKYQEHETQIPAGALSDGTLAWLAFVALYRTTKPGDLVAFDEPELHLHPGLVARAVDLFESMSRSGPVVLATHSDHALDALQDPAKSVVVCELDRERRTQLRRPEAGALSDWMKSYSGYGAIRTAGHEESILRERMP